MGNAYGIFYQDILLYFQMWENRGYTSSACKISALDLVSIQLCFQIMFRIDVWRMLELLSLPHFIL